MSEKEQLLEFLFDKELTVEEIYTHFDKKMSYEKIITYLGDLHKLGLISRKKYKKQTGCIKYYRYVSNKIKSKEWLNRPKSIIIIGVGELDVK